MTEKQKTSLNLLTQINRDIFAICTPYKDIFTTVYFIKTEQGMLLFDTASYDCDVENAIIPALHTLGIEKDDLKYIFISHNHTDHAGGLCRLLKEFPQACIISSSASLRSKYPDHSFLSPCEGKALLGYLYAVSVPGHTVDSCALYDTRSKTLISGDCLQLYGIFGSGSWGANVSFPSEYTEAIKKLIKMDIESILTAHDYHPLGRMYFGKTCVKAALDACLAPFEIIERLISESPEADDILICQKYNSHGDLPTLGSHVIKNYRSYLLSQQNKKTSNG